MLKMRSGGGDGDGGGGDCGGGGVGGGGDCGDGGDCGGGGGDGGGDGDGGVVDASRASSHCRKPSPSLLLPSSAYTLTPAVHSSLTPAPSLC
ncbi:hypothetical protein Pmani_032760 [Petrolisthes manimaculis]|uniref:Uncharacterized protein n=1 Tax=Petrolisthes manimaculis TaxID=1843537 RepID=A0AAE1NSZ2_9EUCA|nr:hypothetical protein Pmani_032760 [Petrolisthes manimaculis]